MRKCSIVEYYHSDYLEVPDEDRSAWEIEAVEGDQDHTVADTAKPADEILINV